MSTTRDFENNPLIVMDQVSDDLTVTDGDEKSTVTAKIIPRLSGAKYPPPPPPVDTVTITAQKDAKVIHVGNTCTNVDVGYVDDVSEEDNDDDQTDDFMSDYQALGVESAGRPTFIAYNSVITGSVEVRETNKTTYWPPLRDAQDSILSPIGMYSKLYQLPQFGNKANEPNYDAMLAMIAMMNDSKFNKTFKLLKVNLKSDNDDNWGEGHFHSADPDTLKLYMELEGDARYLERSDVVPDYAGKHHLFIMSPLSQQACNVVGGLVVSHGSNLVIHYQGESRLVGSDRTDAIHMIGMTSKGSLFANSFNWTAGARHGLRMRKFISEKCDCYTVALNPDVPIDPKTKVPTEYNEMNEYIHRRIFMAEDIGPPPNSINFGTPNVVQDMYDRDNCTSVRLIAENSKKVELTLVGREVPKIMLDKHRVTMHYSPMGRLARFPDIEKKVFTDPMNSLLHFGTRNKRYWPEFHFNNTGREIKQVLDEELTRKENILMAKLFYSMVETGLDISLTSAIDTRDKTTIASAGKPGQDVTLFNEMLFAPGLHMMMHVGIPKMMMTSDQLFKVAELCM